MYGGTPNAPTLVSSEDWNQPRCWSEPSRYMSAGQRSPSSERCLSTLWCETPDSHHTSRISGSGSRSSTPAPHLAQHVPAGRYSAGFFLNHASAPSRSNRSITASNVSALATVSPHFEHVNTGMGTPHERWREMHQSGRSATMAPMRLDAHAGIHSTSFSIAAVAASRRPVLSMDTNHWLVARKMTGSWQRQQCG